MAVGSPFSENLSQVLQSDITFITVGTPSTLKGKIDLTNLKKVSILLVS